VRAIFLLACLASSCSFDRIGKMALRGPLVVGIKVYKVRSKYAHVGYFAGDSQKLSI